VSRPPGQVAFELVVNGEPRRVEADPEMPLLWVLRDRLGLVGPKYGCGLGACGACTVLEGERARRSCLLTLREAAGRSFTTIEGLDREGRHAVQRAWVELDVAQCGYCQGGRILGAVALLAPRPNPSDAEIEAGMHGVLCRCGSYQRVRRAVRRAVELRAEEGGRR
jgi:isoquinoline 1-oxidoreductase alpha subunit